MKTIIMIPLMLLYIIPCFSQATGYEYTGRFNPVVKKEKLNEVIFINDLTPELWRQLAVPYAERLSLNKRKKVEGFYNYNTIVDYVLVVISTMSNGKLLTAKSTTDKLTPAQKNILNLVEDGGDIIIDIAFKFKIESPDATAGHVIKGQLAVTAIPMREAEFPGGYKQFTAYVQKHIFNQLSKPDATEKIQQVVVNFIVDEEGRIVIPRLSKSSSDKAIDKLVLDAIENMPRWKPAFNSKGIRVKQQFSIPLGMGGC